MIVNSHFSKYQIQNIKIQVWQNAFRENSCESIPWKAPGTPAFASTANADVYTPPSSKFDHAYKKIMMCVHTIFLSLSLSLLLLIPHRHQKQKFPSQKQNSVSILIISCINARMAKALSSGQFSVGRRSPFNFFIRLRRRHRRLWYDHYKPLFLTAHICTRERVSECWGWRCSGDARPRICISIS